MNSEDYTQTLVMQKPWHAGHKIILWHTDQLGSPRYSYQELASKIEGHLLQFPFPFLPSSVAVPVFPGPLIKSRRERPKPSNALHS